VPRIDPDKFVRQVTRRVAELRRQRGLTQAECAQRLGVAVKNWQRIEQGQNLTLHTLARVAVVLECTPGDLIGQR
jgi:transcriptional regulator with XRE-family HTH domain